MAMDQRKNSVLSIDMPERLMSVCGIQDGLSELLASCSPENHMEVVLERFQQRMLSSHERFVAGLTRLIDGMTTDEELRTETLNTYLSSASKSPSSVDWPIARSEKRSSYILDVQSCQKEQSQSQPELHEEVLEELQEETRNNADRSLLNAQVADTLSLPADYCEFVRLASEVSEPQPDSRCAAFGTAHGVEQVQSSYCPPRKELRAMVPNNLHITAGWCAGAEKDCNIVCVLSKRWGEEHEPWRWRIVASWAQSGCEENVWIFESWGEFLDWYADWFSRVTWEEVDKHVRDVYWRCADDTGGLNDSGYGEDTESDREEVEVKSCRFQGDDVVVHEKGSAETKDNVPEKEDRG